MHLPFKAGERPTRWLEEGPLFLPQVRGRRRRKGFSVSPVCHYESVCGKGEWVSEDGRERGVGGVGVFPSQTDNI